VWKIDETLTVLHAAVVRAPTQGARQNTLLTGSYEGIHELRWSGRHWHRGQISPGANALGNKSGAPRGTSEVAVGCLRSGVRFLAAIEPWHGNQVVIYLPRREGGYDRVILDDSLSEGHALVVADFDGDGDDEIIAGWRGSGGGLNRYDADDGSDQPFRKSELDRGIAVEGAVATDINGDGRLDLVAIAGRTGNLVWYENKR
jgi:hypothetical protein